MKRHQRVKVSEFRIYYTSFSTPIGRIYLAATEKGIYRVSWGYGNEKDFVRELPMIAMPQKHRQNPPRPSLSPLKGERIKVRGLNFVAAVIKDDGYFTGFKNDMLKYFSGEPVSFKKYAIFPDGTDFQKKVWKVLSGIPYGKVLTYKQVAEKIGKPKASRAVGGACGANELPIIISCHRVVPSSGGLGGFSGGLVLKRQLLKLEGVKIK
ncbi:MAG: hypothetical protein A2Z89_08575 [Deltaproteobacteria bacterium GWA2_43_19]|nr:MAG: hypothetical protein A2Z89_08575 [Deltaproteobacteria bacterium GWA2_43_19]